MLVWSIIAGDIIVLGFFALSLRSPGIPERSREMTELGAKTDSTVMGFEGGPGAGR
jgi:hypothetical protein